MEDRVNGRETAQSVILMNSEFPVYGFQLEFFDERAELVRPYILTYRTERGEIEIFDVKGHRPFLKRTIEHQVRLEDLYVGNKVMINGRQYNVVDFADGITRGAFERLQQRTYAMLKPGFYSYLGEALDRVSREGLWAAQIKLGFISRETASEFYAEHQGKPFYKDLVDYITSGPIVALELVGPNAISRWRQIIGPTNLDVAKREAPNSLRARFARSTTENFAHGSDSPESSRRELGIIFGGHAVNVCCALQDTSLLIIKPHAVREKQVGRIIQMIVSGGFQIAGVVSANLDSDQAGEFYEVYRGVVDEYYDMVKDLCSGPCIAIEVAKPGCDVVNALRDLCGPRDVPVARAIAPNTIRAVFGQDIVRNAVHCTDLFEDAQLEVEYFFTLLQNES
jgi:nucleoside-diphosphate kinase